MHLGAKQERIDRLEGGPQNRNVVSHC